MGEDRLQQGQGRGAIVAEEPLGMEHRLACLDQGSEVKNAVERTSVALSRNKDILQSGPVCQFSLDELNAGGQKVAPAVAEIVEYYGLMSVFG